MLPLQEAVSSYQGLIQFVEESQDFGDIEVYKSTFFPILQCEDLYFVVDCDRALEANIYMVFLEDGNAPIKEYESLEQMFQVIADAYLSRAFYIEDDFLYDNQVLFQKVKNKYLSEEQYKKKEENWQRLSYKANIVLSSQDSEKKYFIRTLYESYDERAIVYLQKFLNDPDPNIIASAVFGLGELKSRESLPELLRLLKHPVESVRNSSANAIAEIIEPQDILLLQPLLDLLSERSLIKISVAEALGRLRNQKAVPLLINCLKDRSSGLRMRALEALQKIGGYQALEALKIFKNKKPKGLELEVVERALNYLEKDN